ncbi:MAG: NRDE family protein [Gammaproteobacteria bacterium]|nr:NRDE family protein [Gammaproteobacteria bacterium]
MCTVFFAWQSRKDLPLIVASNRDEFHQRPTSAAAWQADGLWFGGRDEKDGGSWLGIAKSGRFAVITNFRDPENIKQVAPSRGDLVRRWLEGEEQEVFCNHLESAAEDYNGFNLMFGDTAQLYYFGSAISPAKVQTLAPGLYGLSNGVLDEAWPKVKLGKRRFETVVGAEEVGFDVLRGLMSDRRKAPDEALPNTGVPREWESLLSSLFIVSPAYGTRATTVFTLSNSGQSEFIETRFDSTGEVTGQTQEAFAISHV